MKNCTDQSKGLRWCGFIRFLVRFCGNIYVKLLYHDFTKPSSLRVISMRFAVFLCYSVRCLFVILCCFAIFVPALRPPLIFLSKNFPVMPRTPLGSRRPLGTSTQRINLDTTLISSLFSVTVPFAWYHLSSFSPGCCRGYKAPYTHKSPVCSTRKSKRIAVLNRSCLAS